MAVKRQSLSCARSRVQPAGAWAASHFPWLRAGTLAQASQGLAGGGRWEGTACPQASLWHPHPVPVPQAARPTPHPARPGLGHGPGGFQPAPRGFWASVRTDRKTDRQIGLPGIPLASGLRPVYLHTPAPTPGLLHRVGFRAACWLAESEAQLWVPRPLLVLLPLWQEGAQPSSPGPALSESGSFSPQVPGGVAWPPVAPAPQPPLVKPRPRFPLG